MDPDAKIAQLAELVIDLKKKVVYLKEKRAPITPSEVSAQRRDASIANANEIENSKHACAKAVDQVSYSWETLMDDDQSKTIAGDLTTLESNIAHIQNEIKQMPLE